MQRKRATKRKRIPENLGNRVCGVWPYVGAQLFNAAVHSFLFFRFGPSLHFFFYLFLSFVFFIYPLYFVADILWSLRPSVCDILSSKIQINRKHYMNVAQHDIASDRLSRVTVSIPVYLEDNEVIFETLTQSLAAAQRYQAVSGKAANVLVSDDGLAPLMGGICTKEKVDELLLATGRMRLLLTPDEEKAAQRLRFYREHGIGFVARPKQGRAGLFKKASNLNYTLRLGNAVADGSNLDGLTASGGGFDQGYAEGGIMTHEVILLLDKDSGVHERIIEAILPEFAADDRLAYVQCATNAVNLNENYYTYATGHQVNNLFHNIWPIKALQGFFVPLVGHNVFLRKEHLEKSGLWPENRVSEDFDKALNLYGKGYHGKYAQIKGLEFTEYASRTFTEETGKQFRYAYGLFEMLFDGTIAPVKVRACDGFYMLLYFFSVINQVLLLPTILLESYVGNIHLLWAGFLICTCCFVLLPFVRSLVMRKRQNKESSENFSYSLIIAVSFVGHSFSFLAGACRYLANKIKKNRSPFPSTRVDDLGYSFKEGVKIMKDHFTKNPWLLFLSILCLDRGLFLLTRKGLEPLTKITYCYILFGAVLVPALMTPQLFSCFCRKKAAMGKRDLETVREAGWKESAKRWKPEQETAFCGIESALPSLSPMLQTEAAPPPKEDVALFIESYSKTLQSEIPHADLPRQLLSDYLFESCLRKDPEGKKELYLLRKKSDHQRALLRITHDYPEEDALEEAKLLAGLDHPGVPKVLAAFEEKGKQYIVRHYIEGRSLQDIVMESGCLNPNDILEIIRKLTDILMYLHTQQPPVIHRDIKPQNIIAGTDGSIHLIDFGIARVHKEERRHDTSVILTQDYAPPEQYGFEQTTPLSDIYSLGMVILFLATGRTRRAGLETQITNNSLRFLIEQCIAFNPKARVQSVQEIREILLSHDQLRAKKRKQIRAASAAILAAALFLSALAYASAYWIEKDHSYRSGYERGFGIGYTGGFESAPLLVHGKADKRSVNGNTAGNLAVRGGAYAVEGKDGIFYIADGHIYRMSANASETERFVEDGAAVGLSCCNGWLYYTSGNQVLQCNLYTQEKQVLCQDQGGVVWVDDHRLFLFREGTLSQLDPETGIIRNVPGFAGGESVTIDGDRIFFLQPSNQSLSCCRVSGGGITKLADDCRSVSLSGHCLYYSKMSGGRGALFTADAAANEEKKIMEGCLAMIQAAGDSLYYLDLQDRTINVCSLDGRIRERISKNRVLDFNMAGSWIFYHNEGDGGRLWCVRTDGANDHPIELER